MGQCDSLCERGDRGPVGNELLRTGCSRLDSWQPSYTYVWDFLAIWGLFSIFLLVLRTLTDQVSKVKVRFLKLADQIGGTVFAFLIGWVMICFTMMSLHTAPLAKTFLFGGFDVSQPMFLGLKPDQKWLGFVQMESDGAFCRSEPGHKFDPDGTFIRRYADRRAKVQENIAQKNSIRVGQ